MMATVEFHCRRCGLLTPGLADLDQLPADVDQRRKITLTHDCFHCDAPMEMTMPVWELLKLSEGGESR